MVESERVRTLRELYAAVNREDYDAALELATEDVEFQRPGDSPDAAEILRGRDTVRAWMEPEVFAEQRFEPREFIEHDDAVLVTVNLRARAAASGIELEQRIFGVFRFRDGLIARVEGYFDRDSAESAAGLAESPRRSA